MEEGISQTLPTPQQTAVHVLTRRRDLSYLGMDLCTQLHHHQYFETDNSVGSMQTRSPSFSAV